MPRVAMTCLQWMTMLHSQPSTAEPARINSRLARCLPLRVTSERVNYDQSMNAGLTLNAQGGDDLFAVDDNAAFTTLNGGAGADKFQIGQMFASPRDVRARQLRSVNECRADTQCPGWR